MKKQKNVRKKLLKLDKETLRALSLRDLDEIHVGGGIAGPTCSCTGCDSEEGC